MSTRRNTIKFLYCTGGLFICFFVYGIVQEKITRSKYHKVDSFYPEKFTFMFSLALIQCIVNYVFSKLLLASSGPQPRDTTKTIYYAVCSLSYLLAMISSNMALQFLSYPIQVVGKSAKPIPVMIMGVLLANKTYPLKKYVFILMIVVGLVFFMYKKPQPKCCDYYESQTSSVGFGEMLIFVSLMLDGLMTSCQERMKTEHQTKSMAMMLNNNLWSMFYGSVIVILSGELFPFVAFLQRHPSCILMILLFSLTSAIGQYFIYTTIVEFGPLPCTVIMTVRKFFSVLFSVLFFENSLILRQWIACVVVFAGLFLDMFYSQVQN